MKLRLQNLEIMTKDQILQARIMNVNGLLSVGFTMEELYNTGQVGMNYYPPSETMEYQDDEGYFYNSNGDQLMDLSNYDTNSEGYTPFGDE